MSMEAPDLFGSASSPIEDKEKKDADRVRPLGEEEFKRVAIELAKQAEEAGFEASGQLPPEPLPVEGQENESLAA